MVKMPNLTLFSLRPFPIWNITIQAGKEFEISEWIGKQLVARGVCIEKFVKEANIKAKADRKAKEALAGIDKTEPKAEKKHAKSGKE